MTAIIPVQGDEKHNEIVRNKIIEDKTREVNDGFDGSWIAHPDIVNIGR